MIEDINHIKVNVGQWTWSSQNRWPPLKSVLDTDLWSSVWYQFVRDRLLRPAPSVQFIGGRQFVTVKTWGSQRPAVLEEVTKKETELVHPQTAVCTPSAFCLLHRCW